MKKLALVLACLFYLSPVQAWAATELTITNVQELLAGLGSHRILHLAPGTYNLQGVERQTGTAVRRFHNHGLFLIDVQDLKLIGSEAAQTRIISPYAEEEVLTLHNCTDVQIEGLSIGHTTAAGGCQGDAVLVSNSSKIHFVKDDLYGCGQFALTLDNVTGLWVQDSVLHDGTYGLLNAGAVQDGHFTSTSFVHRGKLSALNLFADATAQSPALSFTQCQFQIDPQRRAFNYEGLPVQEFITKHSLLSRPFQQPAFPVTDLAFTNCSFIQVKQAEFELLKHDGVNFEACDFRASN